MAKPAVGLPMPSRTRWKQCFASAFVPQPGVGFPDASIRDVLCSFPQLLVRVSEGIVGAICSDELPPGFDLQSGSDVSSVQKIRLARNRSASVPAIQTSPFEFFPVPAWPSPGFRLAGSGCPVAVLMFPEVHRRLE